MVKVTGEKIAASSTHFILFTLDDRSSTPAPWIARRLGCSTYSPWKVFRNDMRRSWRVNCSNFTWLQFLLLHMLNLWNLKSDRDFSTSRLVISSCADIWGSGTVFQLFSWWRMWWNGSLWYLNCEVAGRIYIYNFMSYIFFFFFSIKWYVL